MRFLIILLVCYMVMFVGSGCERKANSVGDLNLVKNNNDISNEFPSFLVGTWSVAEDKARWIFQIEPNGTISKMRHFIGADFVIAEGSLVENWKDDVQAVYSLGPCELKYDKDNNNLSIKIVIEHYAVMFPKGNFEGSFDDYLTGPVSGDKKSWKAKWESKGVMGDKESVVKPVDLLFVKSSGNNQ